MGSTQQNNNMFLVSTILKTHVTPIFCARSSVGSMTVSFLPAFLQSQYEYRRSIWPARYYNVFLTCFSSEGRWCGKGKAELRGMAEHPFPKACSQQRFDGLQLA